MSSCELQLRGYDRHGYLALHAIRAQLGFEEDFSINCVQVM